MKLSRILTGLLFLCSITVFAQTKEQESLGRYYSKYPKQAIKEAHKMYQQALKNHDNPLLINSLIIKTTFTLEINRDEFPRLLQELETYILQEQDTATRSILHSYLGELYNIYYNEHRDNIFQRTELKGDIPARIETWSASQFRKKIFHHFLASVAPQKILQQTPISRFNLILIQGNASDSLRPTLYDFLCHRAIDLLPRDNPRRDEVLSRLSPEIFAPAKVFAGMPLTVIPLETTSNILKIWQDLLTFRLQAGNPDALLMADLERLEYARNIHYSLSNDSIYLTTLREMQKQYYPNPMVVEIIAKEARLLLTPHVTPEPLTLSISSEAATKKNKEQALALCEEGVRLYPLYGRINLLWQIINEIKAPEITTEFPKTTYPGENLSININSKNIGWVVITLYRINMNLPDHDIIPRQKSTIFSRIKIIQRRYSLRDDVIHRDTTLQLEIPETGSYEVDIMTQGTRQTLSKRLVCTRLFTTCQSTEKQYYFRTCDWKSGKPIKNVKILIFRYQYPHYIKLDSVYTNGQGIAHYPVNKYTNLYYQSLNPENPASYLESINTPQRLSKPSLWVELITDRQIYRPGQTIYYKGITWTESRDTVHALENKKYEIIFRDAGNKEVSRQQVVSNSFGSFTGSFVIPQQILNGNFTLSVNQRNFPVMVADYKRPEFKIQFTESEQTYYTGDTIRIKGKVSSFSGVNISHTPVKYIITRSSYYFWQPKNHTIQGITQTDANGAFKLEFPAQQPEISGKPHRPYYYTIKATVTDAKGETQESSTSIPVYTHFARPAIKIPEQVNKDQATAFRISLEDLSPRATVQNIRYTLSKLVTPKEITSSLDTVIESTLLQGELQMRQKDSIVPSLRNYPSGVYLFTVECNQIRANKIFYLYSPRDKRPPVPTYSWLVKNKTKCLPGETAQVQFGTSVQKAYILYEIFAPGRLLQQKFRVLSDEIITIDIPYRAEYGSEIWLSIHYVKDKKYIQEIIPIKRIYENRMLTIQTKVFRDKLQPGQKEDWEIRVLTDKNQPALAEVLAMMYDASLNQLVPYEIDLEAGYQYQGFPYPWYDSYFFNANNFSSLYSWAFNQKTRNVPPLLFDKLNFYSFSFMAQFAEEDISVLHTVGYGTEKSRHLRGIASKSMVGTSVQNPPARNAARPEILLRQNFQETAFFYPQLQTDTAGDVHIRFTIPETLTQWRFVALATTKEMAIGQLERYITTSKPFMVRPNLPRFLRSGDQAELKVTLSNLTDSLQEGISTLELFTPENEKIIFSQEKKFSLPAGQSKTVRFPFTVPGNINLAGCRVIASSGNFSDGEQNLIPILPDEILVTKTLPIYTTTQGEHTFTLKNNTPGKDYRLTFELSSQPIWYAVLALPTLTEPKYENVTDIASAFYANTIAHRIVQANPLIAKAIRSWAATPHDPTLLSKLEQNSELKSILLEASPWVLQAQNETERMQSLAELFDQNRLTYLQQQALEKLARLQTPEGGWSWFKGMNSSIFMTANVLVTMARANTTGELEYGEKEKRMQIKALQYLDKNIQKDFNSSLKRINHNQILYLYTRSMYRDIPLGEASKAHHYFMSLAQKQWAQFSLYEKAIIAVAMTNYGLKEDARQIVESLRQYSVTTPEAGMYWPNNKNGFYRNSAVQEHTAIMEAFRQTEGNSPELNLMKQWLLRQKQVQNWASVPATVDAIYALVLTGNDLLAQQDRLSVQLGGHQFSPSGVEGLGYIKESYAAGEIKPDMLTVKVTKQSDTPTWGGLYLQRFEKLAHIKGQQGKISIDKKLYLSQINKNGKTELVPLDQQLLHTGDKVVVRLTLSLKQDMEYLHLKDLRAACFEPAEQLSGNHWKFGTVYYQDVKDAATNFFFNALARGTYVIEYPVWVNQAGEYQDGIATLQSIYAPEYHAFSTAQKIKIKE